MNRAAYLPIMLTGNIGQRGAGCSYLGGQLQSGLVPGIALDRTRASRAGSARIRSTLNLDPDAPGERTSR